MKYFIVGEEMEQEAADKFVSFVNENDGPITIYLCSNGGWRITGQMIVDVINSDPDRFRLVATGAIHSCAFWLFFSAKCKRVHQADTTGIFHLSRAKFDMMSNGKPCSPNEVSEFENLKNGYNQEIEFCKNIGFNKEEMGIFSRGEDVFFDSIRISELLVLQGN